MKPIRVEVNDKMQKRYVYFRTKPKGECIPPRIHPRPDPETDARAWRVWREVHDRLSQRIPGELVQTRQAFAGSGACFSELFWCERVAAALGVAAQGLDPSG